MKERELKRKGGAAQGERADQKPNKIKRVMKPIFIVQTFQMLRNIAPIFRL
jgi:hypothetical protein